MLAEIMTLEQFDAAIITIEEHTQNQPNQPEAQILMAEISEALIRDPCLPALGYHSRIICRELILAHMGEDHPIGAVWLRFLRNCARKIDDYEVMLGIIERALHRQ